MNSPPISDNWERGSPYERYIGRWSRAIAPQFLAWLDVPAGRRWLDVGCGTGALCGAIVSRCAPQGVAGVEPSEGFLKLAAQNLAGRVNLWPGDAASTGQPGDSFDAVVSGLVLNFVPDLELALGEMQRVAVSGGTVAGYVWDYADGMEVIRRFWDVAAELDPAAAPLHEGVRFPLCKPARLAAAFTAAGLDQVDTAALDLTARFADFDDFWQPFLGGQGPAPAYAMSLSAERRETLRARLDHVLPRSAAGGIELAARAWAVRGRRRVPA
ncbi:MAG: class I SAM-dependent methyltransferase [Rhodocyclaceae bacterium]|nr:class I SAM-dependent methyltransferase [Rhodocyclaceae bacterium]